MVLTLETSLLNGLGPEDMDVARGTSGKFVLTSLVSMVCLVSLFVSGCLWCVWLSLVFLVIYGCLWLSLVSLLSLVFEVSLVPLFFSSCPWLSLMVSGCL